MDSAALAALQKLAYLAEQGDTAIVIAETRPEVAAALVRIEMPLSAQGMVTFAPTTDAALEAAEDRLLARHRRPPGAAEDSARDALVRALRDQVLTDRLLALMAREDLAEGATLITAGETGQDIFVVDRGRLAVMARLPDGRRMRVRSLRPGAIVGEIASYAGLPRTADVVAESAATVYRFSPEAHAAAFAEAPELAAAWHEMIAITLSEKIHRTTLMLQESV
jgi:SulP family sulfate permease